MKRIIDAGAAGLTWDAVRDPIYDYVEYNKEVEARIIDTRVFQRLRRIRQLQLAYLVYPGADHTRFQHSLGVMHLAGVFASHLVSDLATLVGPEALEGFEPHVLVEAARIAGLLHDLGHGPFSHAFEDAILKNNRGLEEKGLGDHERIGLALIEHTEVSRVLRDAEEKHGMPHLGELVVKLLGVDEPGEKVIRLLRKVVKAWVYPADVMDFLMRDSYYAGTKEYGVIDYQRLIRNTHPYPELGKHDEVVLERKALGALRSYLYSRVSMYEHVYLHPVGVAFSRLLVDVLRGGDEALGLTEAVERLAEGDPDPYIRLDDWRVMVLLEERRDQLDPEIAEKVMCLVERRNPWKRIGRESRIPLLTGEGGPQPLALALKYHKDWRRDLEERLRQEARSIIGDAASDIWVMSHVLYPAPLASLSRTYPLYEAKFIRGELAEARRLNIYEFMVREGLVPSIVVRAYAPRSSIDSRETLARLSEIFDHTVTDFFSIRSLAGGITL